MLDNFIEILKKNHRTIAFAEGTDARIIQAACRLRDEGILTPVLIGNRQIIDGAAVRAGCDVRDIEVIDPYKYEHLDVMVKVMVKVRNGKLTEDQARATLMQPHYFGTMLLKTGMVDAHLCGAVYTTADTVRAALQLLKTAPGNTMVSSCFILIKDGDMKCLADCGLNISYEDTLDKKGNVIRTASDKLAEVAHQSAITAKAFGMDPRVAFLSYSTKGSGHGPEVDLMRDACYIFKKKYPEFPADGEMQYDCAVVPEVGQRKMPGSIVAGYANTFIFPDISAGNIGYKLCQYAGGYYALGPILQGLGGPMNDLSRGCNVEEVYLMSIITAAMGLFADKFVPEKEKK